ncbi:hypothetical protein ACIP6P_30550 [Streptomyces sp. NPDC088729]|uniref:hypothetical protein n=1 Tax=Streptomyces sp. NPDC088729 TaxID=3365876 RepID=UPI00382DF591
MAIINGGHFGGVNHGITGGVQHGTVHIGGESADDRRARKEADRRRGEAQADMVIAALEEARAKKNAK